VGRGDVGSRDVGSRDKDTASAALRWQLGSDLAVLDQLSEPECAELVEMISEVRATQRAALDKALAEVVGKLPRLARGPARRIMFG
jgi:hypothetical protein